MSNKTPVKPENETKSEPKRSVTSLLLAASFIIFGGYLLLSGVRNVTDKRSPLMMPNGQRLSAEVADDNAERQQGLSGRDGLPADGAMLFKFEQASDGLCFWMKDMKFSIDMVWLDVDRKVVTVRENVSPQTYPSSFCPDRPSQYVIEVPAGKAQQHGLSQGAQVRF